MSIALRIILIVVPIVFQVFMVMRIRKLKMKAADALFWLVFSAVLVFLGLFPGVSISISELLGIISAANFVFLVIIALLMYKAFSLSTQISLLERKLQSLIQSTAVEEKLTEENTKK